VQPVAEDTDAFAVFGLEPRFDIDAQRLERAYVEAQRRLHPDGFATRPERERRLAAAQAVAINEAYARIKAPLARARTLLRRLGRDAGDETNETIDDPAILMEAMETREALAEAMDVAAVADLGQRAAQTVRACQDRLGAAFAAADLDAAARLTLRLAYLDKLAHEIKRKRLALVGAAA
jgi:molecular chaperone HscB